MPVIIGINTHNDLESLKETIKSIRNSTKFYEKIVIVDSGSTDGTFEYCNKIPKTEVIRTKKEDSVRAYNRLLKYALKNKYDILMTHSDVIFPKLYKIDWLEAMNKMVKPNVGLISSINGGGISGPSYVNNFHWIGTWCMYIPLHTLQKVGIFDEKFRPGNGEDIDYSFRVAINKFKIILMDYWVHHHRQTAHTNDPPNVEQIKQRNAEYFRKKWREFV